MIYQYMKFKNLESLLSVVDKLVVILGITLTKKDRRKIKDSLQLLLTWSEREGSQGVKRWKGISDNLVRRRLLRSEVPKGPKIWSRFSWIFRESGLNHDIFVVSVLSFHRLIQTKVHLDLSSILNPNTAWWFTRWTAYYEFYRSDIWEQTQIFNTKYSKKWVFTLPLSEKAGPSGSPAWKYFLVDFRNIFQDLTIWIPFKLYVWSSRNKLLQTDKTDYASFLKFIRATSIVVGNKAKLSMLREKHKSAHSRLSMLSDKSGKTRVVAICDVWSQMVLKPLHDQMFKHLETLKSDGTFDQDRQRRRVKRWNKLGVKLYAYDLSSATDRLPVWIQGVALYRSGFLSLVQSIAWVLLISKRKFLTPHGKYIRYKVGQPMGLLSSWSSLAYTHHAIVWWSSLPHGPLHNRYAILGDDIVIACENTAKSYLRNCERIGLEISQSKSWVSSRATEFAKSLFVEGNDVSPIPIALLFGRPEYFYQDAAILLQHLCSRGINITLSDYLDVYCKGKDNPHIREMVLQTITCPYNHWYYPLPFIRKDVISSYLEFLKFNKSLVERATARLNSFNKVIELCPYSDSNINRQAYREYRSPVLQRAERSVMTVGDEWMHFCHPSDYEFQIGEDWLMVGNRVDASYYNKVSFCEVTALSKPLVLGQRNLKDMRKSYPKTEIIRISSRLFRDQTWCSVLAFWGDTKPVAN